ncbi:GNAT family N-acetyltransferase [Proteus cibi]|uniref:GNAT family N-acetyltransferase n=1 Tax=Proteus cibi TaxID=2050966 RepID=A0ABU6EFN7_9GAMM|nr:GNAT family N-acetyltransferase [Proteus cibi]MEB6857896.1 GNAT family N-acetyltransferase [Proteus cibi]MEB7089327.1 GNAT family N-acetyltransferase [Proteus cibi]
MRNINYSSFFSSNNQVLGVQINHFLSNISALYPNFNDWLQYKFYQPSYESQRKIIIAHNGTMLLGVALLKKSHDENKICTLYTSPFHQGQGIGSQLVDLSLQYFDSPDVLITVAQEKLIELAPILKSKGFVCTASIKGMYRPESTELFFNLR